MKNLIKNTLVGLGAFYVITELPFVIFLLLWLFFAWWAKQILDKSWAKRWNEDFPMDGVGYVLGILAGPIAYFICAMMEKDHGFSILFPKYTFKFQSPLVITKNENV